MVIIVLGMYGLTVGRIENFQAPFEGSVTNPGRIALAFFSGLYSFHGWNFLNYVVEEMKNPIR
jgi:solute carrier family 7 (L-type amino acid transporter), member 5